MAPTSITFDELGVRAHVWRRAGKAVVSDTIHHKVLGTLSRHYRGALNWESYACVTACPIEVFNTVATMI